MAFEVYKPRGERAEKAPLVSLSKTSMVLNNVAREKLAANRVELAFDPDSNSIRVRAVEEGGIEVRKTKLFAKGFYNQFGINKKGKFVAVFDEAERALYVKLLG